MRSFIIACPLIYLFFSLTVIDNIEQHGLSLPISYSSILPVAYAASFPGNNNNFGSSNSFLHTKKNKNQASSTLLKMNKMYNTQPPHDTTLYDILRVSPNATIIEITKSYRVLSRDFHPDKVRHRREVERRHRRRQHQQQQERREQNEEEETSCSSDSNYDAYDDHEEDLSEDDDAEDQLEKVREAYDILKDDSTRLSYHRFGLIDTGDAANILTGGSSLSSTPPPEQQHLLRLMGYGGPQYYNTSPSRLHEQRVMYLAANLVETLRPLVEGVVSQEQLAYQIARECDMLKKLPLGDKIIRCVGRAYRHCGQRVLNRHRSKKKMFYQKTMGSRIKHVNKLKVVGLGLTDNVQDKLRSAKYLYEAAVASGKLVLTEQTSKYRSSTINSAKKKKNKSKESIIQESMPSIGYYMDDDDDSMFSDTEEHSSDNDDLFEKEQLRKADSAVINTLQIQALWKISKVDLDNTIQEACNRILDGEYFFFPSHMNHNRQSSRYGGDGWVGSSGKVIDAEVGRLRAAAAMVLVGDVLVRCSKEGTSWVN